MWWILCLNMADCQSCGAHVGDKTRCPECLSFQRQVFDASIERLYDHFNVEESKSIRFGVEKYGEKVKTLYPRLEQRARENKHCYYGDIYGDGIFSAWLTPMLGTIGHIEETDGRPALTSVVIDGSRDFPDEGYFEMIETFPNRPDDITTWTESQKQEWWSSELEAVHTYWSDRA